MSSEIRQRLREAFIPAYAYYITLQSTQQATLRAVIEDRAYQSKGNLKSISLVQHASMPTDVFHLICARFAAELCIVGQPVLCAGVSTIDRELVRYGSGGVLSECLHPVLQHSGFLFVTNLMAEEPPTPRVQDWLLEFVAMGGAIVCSTPYGAQPIGLASTNSQLSTYLDTTALRVPLNAYSGNHKAVPNV